MQQHQLHSPVGVVTGFASVVTDIGAVTDIISGVIAIINVLSGS